MRVKGLGLKATVLSVFFWQGVGDPLVPLAIGFRDFFLRGLGFREIT